MTILDMLEKDGIAARRVASTSGGEYASACPICGGKDRFRCWPEKGDGGAYWCRTENKGGDCIQYLRDVRGMSYKEACLFLGRNTGISSNLDRKENKPQWEPRETISPNDIWQKKSTALIDWCHEQLMNDAGKDSLEYLKTERGLSEENIKNSRLGWNPKDAWPERKAWGLPEELKENGKPKKLWVPAGIVIPCYVDKALQRVRIRRQNPIWGPPYVLLSGSNTSAMILGANRNIFVIVESELDGILLSQEIGNMAGVMALGNAQTRPDIRVTELLRKAKLILMALDTDPAGAKESWKWWTANFNQAKRWPPIDGKDPGEMWKNGVNLREWIEAGIEKYQINRELKAVQSQLSVVKSKPLISASSVDCDHCRLIIRWPNYPLGGGNKTFCGYWILTEGKGKKIELSKVTRCPKEESLQNKMLLG